MHESGHRGPQYDPLPDPLPEKDDLALRPREAAPDMTEPDSEPELLGPARQSDRSWGTLSAAAVLTVALLGAFLWFHRSDTPKADPPPFAPPPVAAAQPAAPSPAIVEPDPPPPAEPEIVEEQPDEPSEDIPAEPEEPTIEMAPGPARTPPPVQVAEAVESPEPEPSPAPRRTARPERPRPSEPVRVAEARPAEAPVAPPAPKRVAYGPPADRMAGVLRPGPGVEMPVPLDLPRVRYPESARGSGLTVDVHLDLLVDERGRVVEAVVRDGDPGNLGFNEAAVQAALDTRFQPATRWDLPGKAWTELILEFAEPRLEPELGR